MKPIKLRFFSPTDNSDLKTKPTKPDQITPVTLSGFVSAAGKLVLPARTVANLGVDFDTTRFRVGVDQRQRKTKSLYLVPALSEEDTFLFHKAASRYHLALPIILSKCGIDFVRGNYGFTIRPVDYQGLTAFEVPLIPQAIPLKAPYTGKPRGRKPKSAPLVR